jgi:hypothetical protein
MVDTALRILPIAMAASNTPIDMPVARVPIVHLQQHTQTAEVPQYQPGVQKTQQ